MGHPVRYLATASIHRRLCDGINDALALAQSDVGMAMGAGTDIAIESADVVLLGEHLGTIPAAIEVGTQTYAKIRQNLLWAFCFNAVGIPIAASGWLHPTIAIAAMASSTLGILLNSFGLRLSRLATFSVPALVVHPTTAQPAVDGVPVQD